MVKSGQPEKFVMQETGNSGNPEILSGELSDKPLLLKKTKLKYLILEYSIFYSLKSQKTSILLLTPSSFSRNLYVNWVKFCFKDYNFILIQLYLDYLQYINLSISQCQKKTVVSKNVVVAKPEKFQQNNTKQSVQLSNNNTVVKQKTPTLPPKKRTVSQSKRPSSSTRRPEDSDTSSDSELNSTKHKKWDDELIVDKYMKKFITQHGEGTRLYL